MHHNAKGKASAISAVELNSKEHHKGTPQRVRADNRGTTGSTRRKAVSGLTDKSGEEQEGESGGGPLCDTESISSQPTGPTPRLRPGPPGHDATQMSATTSKSGFHTLHSPATIEDDEDDPSPSEGIHIGSSDVEGTQAAEIHRKRAGQRETCNRQKGAGE